MRETPFVAGVFDVAAGERVDVGPLDGDGVAELGSVDCFRGPDGPTGGFFDAVDMVDLVNVV